MNKLNGPLHYKIGVYNRGMFMIDVLYSVRNYNNVPV